MTLKPSVTEELEFINILKSRHARYIDGARVVSKEAVNGDYVPPGAAIGKLNSSGKYAPVTRDKVAIGGADAAENTIPLKNLNEEDWHNWQKGDEIICDPGGSNEETAIITAIDEPAGTLTVDGITTAHAEDIVIQKNDGAAAAEFVCTELIDVSDEDALVGGIVHGAVYALRMPNYDEQVAADLPMIAFE